MCRCVLVFCALVLLKWKWFTTIFMMPKMERTCYVDKSILCEHCHFKTLEPKSTYVLYVKGPL